MPSRTTLVVLSLVPVVVPAAALLAVQTTVVPYIGAASTATRTLLKKDPEDTTASSSSVTTSAADAPPPHSLPEAVSVPDAPYVITCERLVSRPVPVTVAENGAEKPAALLTTYLRGTMEAFTWTPLGLFLRTLIKDPTRRPYFDADVVRGLAFAAGDLGSPVHEVTYRGDGGDGGDNDASGASLSSSRVELTYATVPDLPQLAMHSIMVAEVVRSGSDVVFINETWMWRHAQTEKPTMLESALGRWVHRLVGGWLLFKGIKAVTKK